MNKMSALAEKIRKYYESGLWTITMVENVYKKGKITEEEYRIITEEIPEE